MAVYAVSFELKQDDTYSDRFTSFMAEVKRTKPWWAENTSFVLVQTPEDIDTFCTRIYFNSTFDPTKDRYLVLDTSVRFGRMRGSFTDGALLQLLPYVRKL